VREWFLTFMDGLPKDGPFVVCTQSQQTDPNGIQPLGQNENNRDPEDAHAFSPQSYIHHHPCSNFLLSPTVCSIFAV